MTGSRSLAAIRLILSSVVLVGPVPLAVARDG